MRYTFLFLLLISFFACKQEKANTSHTDAEADSFEAFYNKFHSDSIYQMEHIVFPLSGLPTEVDSVTLASGNFKWQKENWRMHKDLGSNPEFQQEFTALTPDLVIERLTHKKMENVGIIRRFAKMGGEWNLIYYAGLNFFEAK
jgi:hypothetical protein